MVKVKIQRAKHFIFVLLLCAFFAGNICAQSNLELLAEQINRGNSEQKRNALFQIRNLETAEASRLALPALRDGEEIVRATATASVVFLPSDEAAYALFALLRDKKPFVRQETAYALGKTRSVSAIRPLIEIIQKDKIQEVKDAATFALGEIGDVSAINALISILQRRPKTEEEFMRRSAARSLGEIANTQVLQRLLARKNSDNSLPNSVNEIRLNLSKEIPEFKTAAVLLIQILQKSTEADDVKREAAYALGEIGDVSAIFVLQANLSSEDYYLAENCKVALEKINAGRN